MIGHAWTYINIMSYYTSIHYLLLQVYTMAYHVDIQTYSNWYNVRFYLYDLRNLLKHSETHSQSPAARYM